MEQTRGKLADSGQHRGATQRRIGSPPVPGGDDRMERVIIAGLKPRGNGNGDGFNATRDTEAKLANTSKQQLELFLERNDSSAANTSHERRTHAEGAKVWIVATVKLGGAIRLELDEGTKGSVQKKAGQGIIPMNVAAQDSINEGRERLDNIAVVAPVRQLVNMPLGKKVRTGRGASL